MTASVRIKEGYFTAVAGMDCIGVCVLNYCFDYSLGEFSRECVIVATSRKCVIIATSRRRL